VPDQAPWRDAKVDGQLALLPVEEDQVEVEAHGEGVDAGAAGDQQAGPGLLAGQPSKAEQATAKGRRDGDDVAADLASRQPIEAVGFVTERHGG
jgi:hypothetical protein